MTPQQPNQNQMYSQVTRARESPAVWLSSMTQLIPKSLGHAKSRWPTWGHHTGSHFSLRWARQRKEPIGDSMTQINLKSVFILTQISRYRTVERPVLSVNRFSTGFWWVMPCGNLDVVVSGVISWCYNGWLDARKLSKPKSSRDELSDAAIEQHDAQQ